MRSMKSCEAAPPEAGPLHMAELVGNGSAPLKRVVNNNGD